MTVPSKMATKPDDDRDPDKMMSPEEKDQNKDNNPDNETKHQNEKTNNEEISEISDNKADDHPKPVGPPLPQQYAYLSGEDITTEISLHDGEIRIETKGLASPINSKQNDQNPEQDQKYKKGRPGEATTVTRVSTRSSTSSIPKEEETPEQEDVIKYMCHQCNQEIEKSDNVMACDKCENWIHFRCTKLPPYMISWLLEREERKYHCCNCVKTKAKIQKAMKKEEDQEKSILVQELKKKDQQIKGEREQASKCITNQSRQIDQMTEQNHTMYTQITQQKGIIQELNEKLNEAIEEKYRIEDELLQKKESTKQTQKEERNFKTLIKGFENEIKELASQTTMLKTKLKIETDRRMAMEGEVLRMRQNARETEIDQNRKKETQRKQEYDQMQTSQRPRDKSRPEQKEEKQRKTCMLHLVGMCDKGDKCPAKHVHQENVIINTAEEEPTTTREKTYKDKTNMHEDGQTEEMTECEIEVLPDQVGVIIGRQGSAVKTIQQKSGTTIISPHGDVKFIIRGTRQQIDMAMDLMRETIKDAEKRRNRQTKTIDVPVELVGYLIGPQAGLIKEIMRETNTYIETPPKGESTFQITGEEEGIQNATREILSKISARQKWNTDRRNRWNPRPQMEIRDTDRTPRISPEKPIRRVKLQLTPKAQDEADSPKEQRGMQILGATGGNPQVSPVRPIIREPPQISTRDETMRPWREPPKPTREESIRPGDTRTTGEDQYQFPSRDYRYYNEDRTTREVRRRSDQREQDITDRERIIKEQVERCERLYKQFGDTLNIMKEN